MSGEVMVLRATQDSITQYSRTPIFVSYRNISLNFWLQFCNSSLLGNRITTI